jgi:hypothetical protein
MTSHTDEAMTTLSREAADSSRRLSQLAERMARAGASFDEMRCSYAPQEAAVFDLNRARLSAKYRAPGVPCSGVMLIAPFGTGKTHTIEMIVAEAAETAEPGSIPVLAVETSVMGTTDAVPTSILHALKVARPEVGNERSRWLRAVDEMRRAKVEMVIFDEFNRSHRRPTMSAPIVASIRQWIMDPGLAAVGFVGSEEAKTVLERCPEVLERLDDEIDLAPLDWISAQDKTILTEFLKEIDQELRSRQLLDALSGLDEEAIAQGLCEATNGRIRSIMKVIRHAMLCALRRGAPAIETADLFEGVDLMCVRKGFTDVNPFA